MGEEFALAVEQDCRGAVVWITGELDMATAPQLRECLENLNGRGVAINFSALTFMDSGGLAVISWAIRNAAEHGTTLTVRGAQPMQRRLFEITGLAEQLHIDDD